MTTPSTIEEHKVMFSQSSLLGSVLNSTAEKLVIFVVSSSTLWYS